ncbi:MAG: ATP-binding protein [Desulfobacteraceae bacterium]|jgi:signal transduction histidine kinase
MHLLRKQHGVPVSKRWRSILTMLAGLLLVLCLVAILIAQYSAQVDVYRMAQKNVAEHTQKLATLLGYFYGQCFKDVKAFARSREVEGYLEHHAGARSPRNGMTVGSAAIKTAAESLMETSAINGRALFRRILITDRKGQMVYDNQQVPSPASHHKRWTTSTSETQLHAEDDGVIISAVVRVKGLVAGHIVVWLNMQTAFNQILSPKSAPQCINTLVSSNGHLYFSDKLPETFQSCDLEALTTLRSATLSPLMVTCDALKAKSGEYLAMALPISHTPLFVTSMVPASDVTGVIKPWHYGVIMVPLAVIFLSLYVMQLRISQKHRALKTHYAETDRQRKIMAQNNEALAKEIILRKQAEAELKIINEHLEEIVEHRTRKLESAMVDLKNTQAQLIQSGKLASIGELAAGVAHELNQPLMVIRGNAQLMARMQKKSQEITDQLPAYFDTVERNTKRMILIINHLRTFSRQSGSELQWVDINKVIDNAFLMIGEQLRLHNIETVLSLADNLPPVKGNPYQLEQVVLNLVTNARDAIESYQPSGNGYRRPKQIKITTYLKESPVKAVVIRFSDTGCGIRKEDKEKIFDPFFTTKTVGKGTGLGLSITYGILQEHNGSLDLVAFKPGQTTFSITLPVR